MKTIRLFLSLLLVYWSGVLFAQTVLPQLTESQIKQKTIGKVNPKSVTKAGGSFDNYIERRGLNSAAGKGFEALTAIQYNRRKTDKVLYPTAALNSPTSPVDLILYDRRTGKVIKQYQAKLGHEAALEALNDSKYTGEIIILPPDELKIITETISKRELRGRGLPNNLARAKRSIASGQLTATIDGFTLPTREETKSFTLEYLREAFTRAAHPK